MSGWIVAWIEKEKSKKCNNGMKGDGKRAPHLMPSVEHFK